MNKQTLAKTRRYYRLYLKPLSWQAAHNVLLYYSNLNKRGFRSAGKDKRACVLGMVGLEKGS